VRRLILALQEPAGDLKPREAGHLDIEKDQVRLVTFHRRDRFEPVAGLRDDFAVPSWPS